MKQYMDDSFVVVSNMLINYSGQHPVLNVPGRLADIEITSIGHGSFMESKNLRRVVLPPTIKEIGERAFAHCRLLTDVFVPGGLSAVSRFMFFNCEALSNITIYGLELTASEYRALKNSGLRGSEGLYVSHEMPKNKLVQKIVAAVNGARPAYQVPSELPSLFQTPGIEDQPDAFSIFRQMPVLGFTEPSVPVSEHSAFCELLKKHKSEGYEGNTEEKTDWFTKRGNKVPVPRKTIIFTFDDTKTIEEQGKFFINATLKIGYFFWQSALPVIHNKKQYYIYRRNYLDDDTEMKYIHRDIAVFTDHGLVSDVKEAQAVYAKYKLLSVL